jgi:hypothetical protein
MLYYIKARNIRDKAKGFNKRVSKEFLESLDRYVHDKLLDCLEEHNGGKKTLDAALASYMLGNGRNKVKK